MSKLINKAKTTQATNNKQACGVSASVCVCVSKRQRERAKRAKMVDAISWKMKRSVQGGGQWRWSCEA